MKTKRSSRSCTQALPGVNALLTPAIHNLRKIITKSFFLR